MRSASVQSKPVKVARILKRLETRLVGLSDELLAAQARLTPAPEAPPEPKRRLSFCPVVRQQGFSAKRLRFTPVGFERVVVQNWNPHPDFVSLGEVELELEPGQSAAMWVRAGSEAPMLDKMRSAPSNLLILSNEQSLPI